MSKPLQIVTWNSFRFDVANETLEKGGTSLPLTPKAFAVLFQLVGHAGDLVTKSQLMEAVWPDAVVGDAVLKVAIREIRKALGDDSKAPQFIQTVHRRGYRFIAKPRILTESPVSLLEQLTPPKSPSLTKPIVGRPDALAQLKALFERSLQGERICAFLTGPAGIGKTTVIDALSQALRAEFDPLVIMRGVCPRTSGEQETLAPFFDAIRSAAQQQIEKDILAKLVCRFAPTCALSLPGLVEQQEISALHTASLGYSAARQIREMADFLDAITRRSPVLLVLEDLHWSDAASIELITLLGNRRRSSGLLILASWRSQEANAQLLQLQSESVAQGSGVSFPLPNLATTHIHEFLQARLSAKSDEKLVDLIYRKTSGNPLFMVNLVDDLEDEGLLAIADGKIQVVDWASVETHIPDNLRDLIRYRVSRLSPERRQLLEAGSVAAIDGAQLSSVSTGAALDQSPEITEQICGGLCEKELFLRRGIPLRFPDGQMAEGYTFTHALYQEVIYDSIPVTQRHRFHQRIANKGQELYGNKIDSIAHEFAVHMEQCGEDEVAIKHWILAGRRATSASRLDEAIRFYDRAFELTDGQDAELNLELHECRALARRLAGDVVGAGRDFSRMVELAESCGQEEKMAEGFLYLSSVQFWINQDACLETANMAVARCAGIKNKALQSHVRGYRGHLYLNLSPWDTDRVQECEDGLAAVLSTYNRRYQAFQSTRFLWLQCMRAEYDGCAELAAETTTLNRELGEAFDYLVSLFIWTWADIHQGHWGRALANLDQGSLMAEENSYAPWACLFGIMRAHLLTEIGAYSEAIDLCQAALKTAESHIVSPGQILFHGKIILSLAMTRSGDPSAAKSHLDNLTESLQDPGCSIDRLLESTFALANAETRLALGDSDSALQFADRLEEIAMTCGQRDYAAYAHNIRARIEAKAGDIKAVDKSFRSAYALLAGPNPPWTALAKVGVTAASIGWAKKPDMAAHEALVSSLEEHPHLLESWETQNEETTR